MKEDRDGLGRVEIGWGAGLSWALCVLSLLLLTRHLFLIHTCLSFARTPRHTLKHTNTNTQAVYLAHCQSQASSLSHVFLPCKKLHMHCTNIWTVFRCVPIKMHSRHIHTKLLGCIVKDIHVSTWQTYLNINTDTHKQPYTTHINIYPKMHLHTSNTFLHWALCWCVSRYLKLSADDAGCCIGFKKVVQLVSSHCGAIPTACSHITMSSIPKLKFFFWSHILAILRCN